MIHRFSFLKDIFRKLTLPFLLTLLMFSFFTIPGASAAGNLTNILVQPSNIQPGAEYTSYTTVIKIQTSLQSGDKLVIEFPPEFDLSNLTADDISVYANGMYGSGPASIDILNRTFTVELGTVTGTITTMSATIYNVTNPAASGFYELHFTTTTATDVVKDTGTGKFVIAPASNTFYGISLGSNQREASTNHDYNFYGEFIADGSNIRLQFTDEVNLNNVTSSDITASLSTPAIVTVTNIDVINKFIDFSLNLSGIDHNGAGTFSVTNVINPQIGGDFYGNMTVFDNSLNILSSGIGSYYIIPVGSIYPNIEVSTPLTGETATYTVKYYPATNINHGWTVRATFPAGTDLSNVTSGDVSITGADFGTPTVFIDNTNHYVDITVDMPNGDSGYNELTIQIANVVNPSSANTYQLLLEDYNPSSLMIDSGSENYTIVTSGTPITPININLDNYKKSSNTTYYLSYNTPTSISNGWTIQLEFDPLVDLSHVDPNEVNVYGNNFNYSQVTVDNSNHTITYVTDMPYGGSGLTSVYFEIPNIANANTPGTYNVIVTQKDIFGNLINQGTASHPITSNLIINPEKDQRLTQTRYELTYRPVTNISDGYYVKVLLPAGVDLSEMEDNDFSNYGSGMSSEYSKTIDPILRTVEVQLGYNSGDSNGEDISMNLSDVINPSAGGDHPVTMEIYDPTHTLAETLNGVLTIPGEGVITPVVTLSDYNISTSSTYTINYTPSTALDNNWLINLDFPAGTDLSNVTSGDVSLSGVPFNSPTITVDNINHRIQLEVHVSSNNSSNYAVQIVVHNVINTTPPGDKVLLVTEITDNGLLSDTGAGVFTLIGPGNIVGLINPIDIDPLNPRIAQGSDYQITYTPPTNIDNNWKVRLTFPSQYDLSAISPFDVVISGTNINNADNAVIDNTAKTIMFDVLTTGSSSGDPIIIGVNNLMNPSPAGSHTIGVEDFDATTTLIDQGTGIYALTAPLNNFPTASTSLFSNTQANTAQTGRVAPLDLDDLNIAFSAIYNDPDTGDSAPKYQLQIATDNMFTSMIYDSGIASFTVPVVQGTRSEDINLSGIFNPGTTYYWKIRFIDTQDAYGVYSPSGTSAAKFSILDTLAPILNHTSPNDTDTGIAASSPISIGFYDQDSDIDETSLDMTVLGMNAIIDGVCQSGFSCTITPNNHYLDVVINKIPQLPGSTLIPISYSISDTAFIPNTLNGSFSFTTDAAIDPIYPVTTELDYYVTEAENVEYTITYTPPTNIADNWNIVLTFPFDYDLSALSAGNVVMYGTNINPASHSVIVDNNAKTFTITVNASGDSNGDPISIMITGLTNPASGQYNIAVDHYDPSSVLNAQGGADYRVAGLIDPVNVTLSDYQVGATATHTISYTPPTNLQNNWEILLSYPNDFDLSNLTSSDISVSGTNINGTHSITIDPNFNEISIIVDVSGDTNGDPITVTVDGLENACAAIGHGSTLAFIPGPNCGTGTFHFDIVHYDDNDNIIDLGYGIFTTSDPSNNYPGSPEDLYSNTQENGAQSGKDDPYLDSTEVVFSAIFNDVNSGDVANKYQLQIATDDEFNTIVYDSGSNGTLLTNPIVVGGRSDDIIIPSGIIATDTRYYWRIKFWDNNDAEGEFSSDGSSAATFIVMSDADAPIVSSVPAMNATNVSPNAPVILDFIDPGSGVNINSLYIGVAGVSAINGGICETGFTCTFTNITSGIRVLIDPDVPFGTNEVVHVDYYGEDNSFYMNYVYDTLTFTTGAGIDQIYPITTDLIDYITGGTSVAYALTYTPPTNIDDHWGILLTFPLDYDLSTLTAGDITMDGTNIVSTPHNVIIDNIQKTIFIEVQTSGGDSNGDPVTVSIAALDNPAAGIHTIGVEHYDPMSTLIAQGTSDYRIADIITPVNVNLTDYRVENQSTQTITYTPPTSINDQWVIRLQYPDVFDFSALTQSNISIAGTNIIGVLSAGIGSQPNIINIEVSTVGDSNGDPITITVGGLENPCDAVLSGSLLAFIPGPNCDVGTFHIQVQDFDENGVLFDQGSGQYTTLAGVNNYPGSPEDFYSNTAVNTAQTGRSNPTDLDDTNVVFSAIYRDVNPSDVASKYRLVVATDDDFNSIIYDSGATGTALNNPIVVDGRSEDLTVPGNLFSENTQYYWRIKFWDNNNAEGEFSPTASEGSVPYFIIAETNPPVLTYSNPINAATNAAINTPIALSFEDVESSVDDSTYNVGINGVDAVVNGVCQTGYTCNLGFNGSVFETIITPTAAFPNNTLITINYSIADYAPNPNTLSDTLSFTTIAAANNTPTAPTGLFSNTTVNTAQTGSTNPTNLNSTSVVVSGIFNDTDASDTATKYRLEVASDNTFATIVYDSGNTGTNLAAPVAVGSRSEDITVGGTLNVETPYYWRLKFWDNNNGEGIYSSTASFMVADSTAPTLTSSTPTSGAGTVSTGTNIVLNFSDTETPINTATVNVTVGGTNAILNGMCQTGYTCNITPTGNTATVTITPTTALPYATSVTVDYSVSDSATGANTLTSSFSFTTEPVPNSVPGAPTGLFANTAANTAQTGNTNPANLNSTSVVVSSIFQDADASDTATKYQLQVATDNTFTTIVYDSGAAGTNLTAPVAVGNRSEDLAIPGGTLNIETPYFYRIKFWDNTNTYGAFSSTANFMVADLIAPVLASSNPVSGNTSIAVNAPIILSFTDGDTAVNTATINITVGGTNAIVNGACQAGYTCTVAPIPNGEQVSITQTAALANSSTTNIAYSVSDSALVPNTLTGNYSFTTAAATPAPNNGGRGGSGGSGGGYSPATPVINANQNLRGSAENGNTNTVVPNNNQNTVQNANTNTQPNTNQNSLTTQPNLEQRPNTLPPSVTGIPYLESVCIATQGTTVRPYNDYLDAELQNYLAQLNRYGIYMDGNDSRFLPTAPVTRSEILKYVIQGACEMYRNETVTKAPFPDVPVTHKDAYFVNVAKENEIVSGYLSDGTYKPDRPISRAEALKVMIEVFTSHQDIKIDGRSEPFVDVLDSEWYAPYIRFAYEQRIISDTPDHKFNPNAPASREEIAEFLAKSLILKSGIIKSPDDLKPAANANQNMRHTNSTLEQNLNSNTPAAQVNSNSNRIPEKTIIKQGTVPYTESVCPSLEAKTKMSVSSYTDLTDQNLAKFVELLIKTGVAFDPENGKFNENAAVARSELLRFVIEGNCEDFKLEAIKKAPFPDVPVTHKDVFFVYAAKLRSIISGYLTDGTYKPDNDISRAEALKIILEVTLGDGTRTFSGSAQPYTDISWKDPLAWYRGYVSYAVEKGILIVGPDKKFRPNDKATREDIIYFLTQALNIKNR